MESTSWSFAAIGLLACDPGEYAGGLSSEAGHSSEDAQSRLMQPNISRAAKGELWEMMRSPPNCREMVVPFD
jgi:hypothetical protein